VSNLLFFRRSLAIRHAAVASIRNARAMPPGPERRAARRLAHELNELAKTEAWLEGHKPHTPARHGSSFGPAGSVGAVSSRG
jgi:hypothetical protein